MPYTRKWRPTLVDLTNSPKITVKTWDGKPVPSATYFVSAKTLVLTVQEANIYKITARSGPDEETVRMTIPVPSGESLEDRLKDYIDDVVGTGGAVANITPDPNPDNEGYFIVTS